MQAQASTQLADISYPVLPLPAMDSHPRPPRPRTMESNSLIETAFLKIHAVDINPLQKHNALLTH